METFAEYGGLPDVDSFKQFLAYLKRKWSNKGAKGGIFTAAHQNMGMTRLLNTFDFARKNIKSLASKVVKFAHERSLRQCQDVSLY